MRLPAMAPARTSNGMEPLPMREHVVRRMLSRCWVNNCAHAAESPAPDGAGLCKGHLREFRASTPT